MNYMLTNKYSKLLINIDELHSIKLHKYTQDESRELVLFFKSGHTITWINDNLDQIDADFENIVTEMGRVGFR